MIDRIGREVERELRRFGPAGEMAEILRVWATCVGDVIARNALPARVARDGTLHVATSSSTWSFELAQLEPTIRARLREALGETAPPSLRFAPGRLPEAVTEPLPNGERSAPPPSELHQQQATALVAAIDDDELREIVQKAAALSLARAESGRRF